MFGVTGEHTIRIVIAIMLTTTVVYSQSLAVGDTVFEISADYCANAEGSYHYESATDPSTDPRNPIWLIFFASW